MLVDRKATITEPENYQRVFGLAAVGPATMPGNFQSAQLPGNTPLAGEGHPYGTLEIVNRNVRNSFYLGPVQAATPEVGTALEGFTWEKLKQTRIRHWLISDQDQGSAYHLKTLNHEQSPSPGAYTQGQSAREGQITWFDYEGKTRKSTPIPMPAAWSAPSRSTPSDASPASITPTPPTAPSVTPPTARSTDPRSSI